MWIDRLDKAILGFILAGIGVTAWVLTMRDAERQDAYDCAIARRERIAIKEHFITKPLTLQEWRAHRQVFDTAMRCDAEDEAKKQEAKK